MESFVQGKGDNHRIISSWPQSWCLADGAAQQEAAGPKLAELIRAHESAPVMRVRYCITRPIRTYLRTSGVASPIGNED